MPGLTLSECESPSPSPSRNAIIIIIIMLSSQLIMLIWLIKPRVYGMGSHMKTLYIERHHQHAAAACEESFRLPH